MSVVYRNLPVTGSSQVLSKVRFAPQFVRRFSTLAQRNSRPARSEITGLLYGSSENSVVTVQEFKSFLDRPESSDSGASVRASLADAFDKLIAASRTEPEISTLEVLGWYSLRPAGGLLGGDVDFHNLNFFRPTDIALVAWQDSGTDLLLEVYSRSADALLSPQDHRSGVVRIGSGATTAGPVEVTVCAKISDDFYLRTYGLGNGTDPFSTLDYWKRALASASQTFAALKPKIEKLKITPANPPEPIGDPPDLRKPAEPPPNLEGQEAYEAAVKGTKREPEVADLVTLPPAKAVLRQMWLEGSPGVPALRTPPKQKVAWTSAIWMFSVLIFAFAAGCTFVLIYGLRLPGRSQQLLMPTQSNTALGMRLDPQGDRLLLSWNRSNPVVISAQDGLLRIADGSKHREVHLDAAQVANGSVLYQRNSDDVTFELDVHGKQGNTLSESIRVLDSQKSGKAPNSSAPKPEPRAPEAKPVLPVSKPVPPLVSRFSNNLKVAANAEPVKDVIAQPVSARPPITENPETSPKPLEATLPNRELATASTPTETAPQQIQPKPSITEETVQRPPTVEPLSPKPEQVVQPPAPKQPAPAVYVPPQPLKQVLPKFHFIAPAALLNSGELEVTVQVDAKGNVTAAHLENPGGVNSALGGAALSAAKRWIFRPATLRGQAIASRHTIVFRFQSRH